MRTSDRSLLALKLYGSTNNVIAKVIEWDHEMLPGNYVITGILEDAPMSSSKKCDVPFSYDYL